MPSPDTHIAEALTIHDQAQENLEVAQQRVTDAKRALTGAIHAAVSHAGSQDELMALLRSLYWETPTITTRDIQEAFGMKVHEVVQAAGTWVSDICCPACGDPFVVTSRQALKELRAKFRKYSDKADDRFHRPLLLCDPCRADLFRVRNAQWEQEKEALRQRQHELHTMPYREYLQTPEWQESRKRALKRARYRCELCNGQGRLNVHHRTYERRGFEDMKDLITLCATCHQHFHDHLEVQM